MRTLRLLSLSSLLLAAPPLAAQTALPAPPAPAPAPPDLPVELGTPASAHAEGELVEVDPLMMGDVAVAPEHRTGFTTGLRLGIGMPLGKAGQNAIGNDRDLQDLTPWRAPVWLDLGYTLSGAATIGAYVQVGVGGTGDSCVADCDWSDIRLGAAAEWRFAPGSPINPWLGLGLGYEWLSYRVLATTEVPDDMGGVQRITGRATERFGGPELMLHGGIDFQVEDALRIGPYASATVGQYLTDDYSCQPDTPLCPEDGSIDGAAFHSWIGVGLRGAYTP